MKKVIAAVGVVAVGVVVLVVALAADLFSVAPAFEDLTDGFRDTVMTDEAIAQAQTDVAALGAVGEEFTTAVVPTLSQQLGMDAAGFNQFMGDQFPAVATGAQALPSIVTQFTDVVNLIDEQQANFMSADEIPTKDAPATTVPWLIAGIAVVTILVGLYMFVRFRTGAMIALVLGILVVASTLVLNLVGKSGDADAMNDAFRPSYTQELVDGSGQALAVVSAMGNEMQTSMLPGLAGQLGMSASEVQAFLGENFPATAAALQSLPEALGRFEVMVSTFDAQLENYEAIKDTELSPVAWTVLIGGILTALFGLYGVLVARQGAATTPRN
jgi:hypothetical protein